MSLIKRITFSFLFICYLVILALVLEFGSRIILPISAGVNRVSDNNDNVSSWLESDSSYYQVSSEFHKLVTVTKYGTRSVGNEGDLGSYALFVGDSFTFGMGLSDEETIPYLVCKKLNIQCINAGVPGTGLVAQRKVVRRIIKDFGPPLHLFYFPFLSVVSGHPGNDINDTAREAFLDNSKSPDPFIEGKKNMFGEVARWLSINSNLVRILRYNIGNQLREIRWKITKDPPSNPTLYTEILKSFIAELDQYDINTIIFQISSVGEILNENHILTNAFLKNAAQKGVYMPIYDLSKVSHLFYSNDGHFNARGAEFFAKSIITEIRLSNLLL